MATVSKVAEFLGVDRDKVKRWTKDFAEYLSLTANPGNGKERQFSEADFRVLAVIAEHLELGNDADDCRWRFGTQPLWRCGWRWPRGLVGGGLTSLDYAERSLLTDPGWVGCFQKSPHRGIDPPSVRLDLLGVIAPLGPTQHDCPNFGRNEGSNSSGRQSEWLEYDESVC